MINNISPTVSNLGFKSIKQSSNGVNYHHTNAGKAVGAAVAGLGASFWLSYHNIKLDDKFNALRKMNIDDGAINLIKAQIERLKKNAIPFGLIAMAASIGCGFIIDKIRNKKSLGVAESVQRQGVEKTYQQNMDTKLTRQGNLYYHSKDGRKKGVLLGAVCGIAHSLMINKKIKLGAVGTLTLGGFLAGLITDSIANKQAKKNL